MSNYNWNVGQVFEYVCVLLLLLLVLVTTITRLLSVLVSGIPRIHPILRSLWRGSGRIRI